MLISLVVRNIPATDGTDGTDGFVRRIVGPVGSGFLLFTTVKKVRGWNLS